MTDKNSCPLLDLAPELRQCIWEDVFEEHVQDHCLADNDPGDVDILKQPKAPGLLLACKQTHGEALGAYYRGSQFRFTQMYGIESMAVTFPTSGIQLMQKISLDTSAVWHCSDTRADVALESQLAVFHLCRWLKEKIGHPQPEKVIYEVPVKDFDGRKIWGPDPWKTYTELVVARESANIESEIIDTKLMQEAKNARSQAEFFDYDHKDAYRCFNYYWRPRHNVWACRCEKKSQWLDGSGCTHVYKMLIGKRPLELRRGHCQDRAESAGWKTQ